MSRVTKIIGALTLSFAVFQAWTATCDAVSPPKFQLKTLSGDMMSLKDHLGEKVILINFWATWCRPCRRELPEIQKLHEKWKEQGFLALTISNDPAKNLSKLKAYMKRYKYTFTVLLDQNSTVIDKYNPKRTLPYSVLIGKDGNIVKIFDGYKKGDEKLLFELTESLLKGEKKDEEKE